MKVLIVSHIWEGFREVLYQAGTGQTGMPAFIKVLEHLVDRGHEIDLICIAETSVPESFNISSAWTSRLRIVNVIPRYRFGRALSAFLVYWRVNRQLSVEKYDVVFAHGPISHPSVYAARQRGVPFVQRLYGTFYLSMAERDGWLITALMRPFEFLSFVSQKDALIMTDDGTSGDQVVRRLTKGNPPYQFFFPVNGVDDASLDSNPDSDLVSDVRSSYAISGDFIFMCGRLDRWKGQIEVLTALRKLRSEGYNLSLVLAGQVSDQGYLSDILAVADELGVSKFLYVLGGVERSDVMLLSRLSTVTVFNQSYSNFGNAFHEIFSHGGLVACRQDQKVEQILKDGVNGLVFSDMDCLVEKVSSLLLNPHLSLKYQMAAREDAQNFYSSWEQRCKLEEEILVKSSSGRWKDD